MTDLRELIERVEKATGPDREIDRAVAEAAGYAVEIIRVPKDHPVFKEGGGLEFMIDVATGTRTAIPDYTASLDAVIELVERDLPGRGLVLARGRIREDEPLWGAQICNIAIPEAVYAEAEHHTPALALLLALLRALRAKEQT